jgi:hypothetical protein
MPTFAPNVTPRYKVSYQAVGRVHSLLFRGARGLSFGDMETLGATAANAMFNPTLGVLVDDFSFLDAAVALTDSDIFLPAALPTAEVGTADIADYSKQDSITHVTFAGRGAGGAKVNWHLFGITLNPDVLPPEVENDFKITSAEWGVIANVYTVLAAQTGLRAIDNTAITYKSYALVKVNDHWLRKVRQGA